MNTYTVICQDSIVDQGFEKTETSKARAIKFAREFVTSNVRNKAQASVVIYGTRANGERCLVRRLYKCVNRFGRAVLQVTA